MAERSRLFIVLLCSLECILCTWMTNLLLSFFITISTSVLEKSFGQDDFHFMEYTQSGTEEILLLLDFVFWSKVSRIHCWLRILAEGKEHCSSHVSQLSISYNMYLTHEFHIISISLISQPAWFSLSCQENTPSHSQVKPISVLAQRTPASPNSWPRWLLPTYGETPSSARGRRSLTSAPRVNKVSIVNQASASSGWENNMSAFSMSNSSAWYAAGSGIFSQQSSS